MSYKNLKKKKNIKEPEIERINTSKLMDGLVSLGFDEFVKTNNAKDKDDLKRELTVQYMSKKTEEMVEELLSDKLDDYNKSYKNDEDKVLNYLAGKTDPKFHTEKSIHFFIQDGEHRALSKISPDLVSDNGLTDNYPDTETYLNKYFIQQVYGPSYHRQRLRR